jgi:hypothetical protein
LLISDWSKREFSHRQRFPSINVEQRMPFHGIKREIFAFD